MMIVNEDASAINKLEDDVRVIIYNCHMFIVQATGLIFVGKAILIPPFPDRHCQDKP